MKILAIDEKWIKGYENLYSINKKGEVRSHLHKKEKKLTNDIDKDGYYRVDLCKNKKRKRFFVHRLVAINFIPNIKNKPEVNHKDGNKQNNYIDNLEWVTRSENELHAYKNELAKIDNTRVHNSKKVMQIDKDTKQIISKFNSTREAERETGIFNSSISKVCNKKQKTAGGFVWKFEEEYV